jgi:hypothetical protein
LWFTLGASLAAVRDPGEAAEPRRTALKHRFPWSRLRGEVALAAVVLLVMSGAVAGLFRGVLALRSSEAIAPGSVDFLLVALVWVAAGFGLDACLRRLRTIWG